MKNALLLALALLLVPVQALDPNSPKDIGKASVFLQVNWTVDFPPGGLPSSFTLRTFGFANAPFQTARIEPLGRPYRETADALSNRVLEYEFSPTAQSELVGLRAFVDVDYSKQPNAQPDAGRFAEQSTLTQPSAEMDAKAAEVRARASSDLEAIVLLTEWVHNRMKYDGPGYGDNVQEARWVYENAIGTCDEFSHLLVSMLRSVKIPAKFVAGYVCSANCTRSENWGKHAWVEAFANGEWVSSDPTFNEALPIDATHVKFAEGYDQNDIKLTLSATPFNYPLGDVGVSDLASVSLDGAEPFDELFELSVRASNSTVGEGAIASVHATVKSKSAKPAGVPLDLSVPSEVRVIGGKSALVFLAPGDEEEREWKLLFPDNLDEGYIYNFTAEVRSLSASKAAYISARKGAGTGAKQAVRVGELTPRFTPSGSLEVTIEAVNEGNSEVRGARALLETNAGSDSKEFSLAVGETKDVAFTLEPGELERIDGKIVLDTGTFKTTQPIAIALPKKREGGELAVKGNFLAEFLNGIISAVLEFLGFK